MRRYLPDFESFRAQSANARIIPVYRQLLADHLTPVSAFQLLARNQSHAFLLESVVGGEKIGRYSFIATGPVAVYSIRNGQASLTGADGKVQEFASTNPLADLQNLLPKGAYYANPKLPAFTGGLVGYAGYDTIRYYEAEKLAAAPKDDRGLPDLLFGLYQDLVIFDHVDKTIKVVANASMDGQSAESAYEAACRRVDETVKRLQQPSELTPGEIDTTGPLTLKYESNYPEGGYQQAVSSGKEYIRAGDIFQFVPSQRLRVKSQARPLDVYRALRVINPSPYMFYLKNPACTLIGSSPEILCSVIDGVISSRPLAGTRRRGKSAEEDAALEKELLADPKERAEHIMLVDLHRNDVGRVSEIGSVKISDALTVERYSHVMHIVTLVTGKLSKEYSSMDALRVSLPVGTVSGAPKIRAMQIIDELEPTRRGPYGGAVGYVDLAGNMDTCIALRTIVWRDGVYDVQSGAGVVADSDPQSEYEEAMNKARALLKAVDIAEQGF